MPRPIAFRLLCSLSEEREPGEKLIGCGDEVLGGLYRLCGLIGAGVVLGEVRVLHFVAAAAKGSEGPEALSELAADGLLDGVVATSGGGAQPLLG